MSVGMGRVLIVEDEVVVAMSLEDMLLDLGYAVVGPASHLEDALLLASTEEFDAALLDVNLAGKESYPVADLLQEGGVPFAFTTGYGAAVTSSGHADVPVLAKPYRPEGISALLRQLIR